MARDYSYIDKSIVTEIDNLENYEPGINMVLVKPIVDTSKVGSAGLIRDTYFEEIETAKRVVEVVKVPKGLSCKGDDGIDDSYPTALDWKTTMQLEVGDVAWVDPIFVVNNNNTNDTHVIICKDEIYFIIRYDRFFVAKRKGETIPLNGYVVIEEIFKTVDCNLLDHISISNHCRVITCGDSNLYYFNDYYSDDISISSGDRILSPNNMFSLDGDMYDYYEKGKNYHVVQRRNILYNYGKYKLGEREFAKGKNFGQKD